MILMVFPLVAGDLCEDILTPGKECTMFTPAINCTTYNYSIFNETDYITNGSLNLVGQDIYSAEMNLSEGSYLWRLCERSTREIIVRGDDEMAGVAITMFILAISAALFIIPFSFRLHPSEFLNMVFKRSMIALGFYFMTLNSAMMATIADYAGLELTGEMFAYMFIFGWAGYVAILILVIKTLFDIISYWKLKRHTSKYGED